MLKTFRTFNLAVKFYRLSSTLKLDKAAKDQLTRAALSIALNLAEGHGKPTPKDQKRFFNIAMGSLRECQAVLLAVNPQHLEAELLLDSLGAHLYRLIQYPG